jgi:hypothetical protein
MADGGDDKDKVKLHGESRDSEDTVPGRQCFIYC